MEFNFCSYVGIPGALTSAKIAKIAKALSLRSYTLITSQTKVEYQVHRELEQLVTFVEVS